MIRTVTSEPFAGCATTARATRRLPTSWAGRLNSVNSQHNTGINLAAQMCFTRSRFALSNLNMPGRVLDARWYKQCQSLPESGVRSRTSEAASENR